MDFQATERRRTKGRLQKAQVRSEHGNVSSLPGRWDKCDRTVRSTRAILQMGFSASLENLETRKFVDFCLGPRESENLSNEIEVCSTLCIKLFIKSFCLFTQA